MIMNKRRYFKKILENPLPLLPEDERIYLNVPFENMHFARACNCDFDSNKKLWSTGIHNTFLHELVALYGVNNVTSEKAMLMLKETQQ